jgi:hypothetical protein
MDLADQAIDLLVAATADEHATQKVAPGVAHLETLRLFVQIRPIQAMAAGAMALFVCEITASARAGEPGITVTAVGQGGDPPSAVGEALAHWALGTLPVLAQWRGGHSCLPATSTVDTRAGVFELLKGPTVARGMADSGPPPGAEGGLIGSITSLIEAARPAPRLHWIELFACKFAEGEVDATCRLNNHDWPTATRTLKAVATGWPAVDAPLQTQRQFVLLRPQGDPAQEIRLPSFWSHLTGRA